MMSDSRQLSQGSTVVGEREFVMERVYDAPRELLFEVFTQPEHLSEWWAPVPFTIPVCNLDLRPGGRWHYAMRSPEGEDHWALAIFTEVEPPERFAYTCTFADAQGNPTDEVPVQTATFTFDELNGKTKVTIRFQFGSAEEMKTTVDMGMIEGLTMTLDTIPALLTAIQA